MKYLKHIKLENLKKGTLLYNIASVKIKINGYYNCIYLGEAVTIR